MGFFKKVFKPVKKIAKAVAGNKGIIKKVLGKELGGFITDATVAVATGGVGLAVKKGLELQNRKQNQAARLAKDAQAQQAESDKQAQAQAQAVQAEQVKQEQALQAEQVKVQAEAQNQSLQASIKENRRKRRTNPVRTVFGGDAMQASGGLFS